MDMRETRGYGVVRPTQYAFQMIPFSGTEQRGD
jgi:hypothetical protein